MDYKEKKKVNNSARIWPGLWKLYVNDWILRKWTWSSFVLFWNLFEQKSIIQLGLRMQHPMAWDFWMVHVGFCWNVFPADLPSTNLHIQYSLQRWIKEAFLTVGGGSYLLWQLWDESLKIINDKLPLWLLWHPCLAQSRCVVADEFWACWGEKLLWKAID